MMATTNTVRLEARISPALRALLKQAAETEGRTITDFVSSAVFEAATKSIEKSSIIRFSLADQTCFSNALLDPPEPNTAMKRAVERNKKYFAEKQ